MKITFNDFYVILFKWIVPTDMPISICWNLIFLLSKSVKSKSDYLSNKQQIIDFCPIYFFTVLLKYWLKNIPFERTTEYTYFNNNKYHIKKDVYIPKHETTTIITSLKQHLSLDNTKSYNYLDLCCGSGALSIEMMKTFNFKTSTLIDIDKSAIENSSINLKLHNQKATLINKDWTKIYSTFTQEIITANFPYLQAEDKVDLSLLLNEPIKSLYSDHNPVYHYENLLIFLSSNKHWKYIALEISPLLKKYTNYWIEYCNKNKWKSHIYYDINSLERCLMIYK